MITRKQLHEECDALFERQCDAHGLDSSSPMLLGVYRNLMQFVLDEWSEAESELRLAHRLAPPADTSGVVEKETDPDDIVRVF